MMGILGIVWENTTLGPGTKLPHILCALNGPLQLAVVVVSHLCLFIKVMLHVLTVVVGLLVSEVSTSLLSCVLMSR